jgi:hypothetical protein
VELAYSIYNSHMGKGFTMQQYIQQYPKLADMMRYQRMSPEERGWDIPKVDKCPKIIHDAEPPSALQLPSQAWSSGSECRLLPPGAGGLACGLVRSNSKHHQQVLQKQSTRASKKARGKHAVRDYHANGRQSKASEEGGAALAAEELTANGTVKKVLRKLKAASKAASKAATAVAVGVPGGDPSSAAVAAVAATVVLPRKRGRPPKQLQPGMAPATAGGGAPKRGRPAKKAKAATEESEEEEVEEDKVGSVEGPPTAAASVATIAVGVAGGGLRQPVRQSGRKITVTPKIAAAKAAAEAAARAAAEADASDG